LISDLLDRVVKDLIGLAKQLRAVIVLEDLGYSKFVESGKWDKLFNLRHGDIVRRIVVMCKKSNVPVVFVEPNGTSRTCSRCGMYYRHLKFRHGKFKCKQCGLVIDRDVNAAINIAKRGLGRYLEGYDVGNNPS